MKIDAIPAEINRTAVANLYESVGYGRASDYIWDQNLIRNLFPEGVYGFFAVDENEETLLGMLRVFSDDYMCSWVAEMCVAPGEQSHEIEAALLRALTERFGHTAIYTQVFAHQIGAYFQAGIVPKPRLTAVSKAPRRQHSTNTLD